MKRILFGIPIVFYPEEENKYSWFPCKFDSGSNDINESELQRARHIVRKSETDNGITIILNREE
jgi:hypothetical protein